MSLLDEQIEADQRKCVETAEAIVHNAIMDSDLYENNDAREHVWNIVQPLISLCSERSYLIASLSIKRRLNDHLKVSFICFATWFLSGLGVGVALSWAMEQLFITWNQ